MFALITLPFRLVFWLLGSVLKLVLWVPSVILKTAWFVPKTAIRSVRLVGFTGFVAFGAGVGVGWLLGQRQGSSAG